MTDNSAQVDTLLLKSLLGENIVDINFYAFSSRSKQKQKIFRPRALHANSKILSERSPCLADLLSEKKCLTDHAMFEFQGAHNHPRMISFGEYGYDDDSDMEDEAMEDEGSTELQIVTDGKSERVSSDYREKDDERMRASDKLTSDTSKDNNEHIPDGEPNHSRNIFVKNAAFRTWKALLFYLYTGRIRFTFLQSAGPRIRETVTSTQRIPTCSAKSMYHLACNIGLEDLQTRALDSIRGALRSSNIVTELGSSLLARCTLPNLFRRIGNGELHHGADILKDLYEKFRRTGYTSKKGTSGRWSPDFP
ncbi:hypothetical protein V8B97DRAFT_1917308 [Scleroderma yunnanense]